MSNQETFQPHGYIVTERRVPRPIFIATMVGVDRLLRLDFDHTAPPLRFVSLTRRAFAMHMKQFAGNRIPGFGEPTGFIINYAPNTATRFALDGTPLERLDRAYAPGQASLKIGNRENAEQCLQKIIASPRE